MSAKIVEYAAVALTRRVARHATVLAVVVLACFALLPWKSQHPVGAARTASKPCVFRGGEPKVSLHPVVAFGDSITWGTAASINCVPLLLFSAAPLSAHIPGPTDTTYPGALSHMVHAPILNYGVPGEVTSEGETRLAHLLIEVSPRAVLILEGVNDLALGDSPAHVVARLATMIAEVRRAHARPVLLTLTRTYFTASSGEEWVNGKVSSVRREILDLAHRERVTVVDLYRAFPPPQHEKSIMLHSDGSQDFLHPNDAGYALIARTLAPVVMRLLHTGAGT